MLSGFKIHKLVKEGFIKIKPFNVSHLQPNSYDITLGNEMKRIIPNKGSMIDTMLPGETETEHELDTGGFVIWPNEVYLGHTVEYICGGDYAPMIEGRSSMARHGVAIHITAGFGDVGFEGQFTLEIVNLTRYPTIIYPGTRVGQIFFVPVQDVSELYNSGYQSQTGARSSKGVL